MERAILFTGVGGQGVQLAAQVLARAAVHEGRHVTLLGTWGGSMRGGQTDSTLIVADAPVGAPPIVARAWAALAMHHQFWAPTAAKLEPGAVVAVNAPVFATPLERRAMRVFDVAAAEIAAAAGQPLAASLVLVAAFARLTGLVALASLVEGMRESLPPYRRQHLAGNESALRAGFEATPAGVAPAWAEA
jgi:Pyruvate/2-oxoacid:ferredoxin oxidoreductase gamma subunit